jgi:hypothetical protein
MSKSKYSKKPPITPSEENSHVNEQGLLLMYSEIKERSRSQQESVKELGKKANGIIGFVGVMTGLGTTWFQSSIKEQVYKSLETNLAFGLAII